MNFDLSSFAGTESFIKAAELSEYINQEMFLAADTGISNHTINHWERQGLIDGRRTDEKNWRRFTFVEFVWIRMIGTMRKVGLSLDVIREAKGALMEQITVASLMDLISEIPQLRDQLIGAALDKEKEEVEGILANPAENDPGYGGSFSLLQLLIASTIAKRCPVAIAIFLDGDCLPLEGYPPVGLPAEEIKKLNNEPFVHISISQVVKEFLSSDLAPSRIGSLHVLDENETSLLELIHTGEYKKITVNFKDSEMDSLELVKDHKTTRRIVDVLADAEYQDITLVTHKGLIAKIENTTKVKLPRK